MAREYEDFRGEDKGKAVETFQRANPAYWNDIQRNPVAIEEVRKAQEWAEARRAHLWADYEEHKQERIGREAVKVFEERSALQLNHPPAPGSLHSHLSQDSILAEARRRVWANAQQEEAEVTRVEEDTINQIVAKERMANMTQEEKNTHIKAEMHQAVEAAQTARTQARRLFTQHRVKLIEEAREGGSETPERDVSIAQAKVMKDIDRQEHKDLHAIFQNYGWSYENRHAVFGREASQYESLEEAQEVDQSEDQSNELDSSHSHDR